MPFRPELNYFFLYLHNKIAGHPAKRPDELLPDRWAQTAGCSAEDLTYPNMGQRWTCMRAVFIGRIPVNFRASVRQRQLLPINGSLGLFSNCFRDILPGASGPVPGNNRKIRFDSPFGDGFLVVSLSAFLVCLTFAQAAKAQKTSGNPDIAEIRDMHLITSSEGCLLGDQRVLLTNSACHSWADITPPLKQGEIIDRGFFVNADHGWAVLRQVNSNGRPSIAIVTTTDRGRLVRTAFSNDHIPQQGYAGIDLDFADETDGWLISALASSSASRGQLFATHDGGETWSRLPDPPIAGSIQFLSESTGWTVGGALIWKQTQI
jgi:hypothetical protein